MTAAALKGDYLSYPNVLRKLLYCRAVVATLIRASHFPVINRRNCSAKKISNVQLGYIRLAELRDCKRKKEWTERNARRRDSAATVAITKMQDDRIRRLDRREKEAPFGFCQTYSAVALEVHEVSRHGVFQV